MELEDYLLSMEDIDWTQLFSEWTWLIPPGTQIQPWMMNAFGDLFWFDEREQVNFLNISDGTNEVVAETQDEFFDLLEDEDNLTQWLLIDLVEEAQAEGLKLEHDQCYGFKVLPTLEGEFEASNVYVSDLYEYWDFCGIIGRQIDGLPDGSDVTIEIPDREGFE
jgi:hypothetical protein